VWLYTSDIKPEPAGEKLSLSCKESPQVKVIIAPGMGDLYINALEDSADIIEGTVRGGNVEPTCESDGNTATYTIKSGSSIVGPFPDKWHWELGLSPEAPLDLNIDFGVGQAEADLTDLDISNLDVHLAIGNGMVTLPRDGSFSGNVDGSIGQLVIVIPEGMAARIAFDTGIAARQVPNSYDCVGDVCTSPGYSGADDKVDLAVHMAIGNVVIR
jgi:hypothetical protein